MGRRNMTSEQILVESSSPVAQFSSTPTSQWKYPSQFVLDAGLSDDIDMQNGFDTLQYTWTSPGSNTTVIDAEHDKTTTITFNTP